MIKIRDKFLPLLSFVVGDGKSIFAWHDPWHHRGALLRHYGDAVIYGSRSSFNAKLSNMIHIGAWSWPVPRSHIHIDLQSFLPHITPTGGVDTTLWLAT